MKPQIDVFGKSIGSYALFGIIGILLAGFLVCRLLKRLTKSDTEGLYLILIAGMGAIVGSHVLYAITRIGDFSDMLKSKSVIAALAEIFGGGVFYGGLLGGVLAGYIYLKLAKLDIKIYSDVVAVCIPLFHSFARVGCFFAGCCYGKECEIGFASKFNPYIPEVVGVIRFPIQLVEAMCNFALFCVLLAIFCNGLKKNKQYGFLFYIYLIAYSIIRFVLEFFRGDTIRGILWGFSTSQWISMAIFAVTVTVVAVRYRKRNMTN